MGDVPSSQCPRPVLNCTVSERMSVFICGTFERCDGAGQRRCLYNRYLRMPSRSITIR